MGAEHYYLFKAAANNMLNGNLSTLEGCRIGTLSGNMEKVLREWLADNDITATVQVYSEAGFKVDIAADGTEAVEKIKQAKTGDYDLILMDIQMPQMNGFDATRAIRNLDAELAEIPIYAMSANAFEEDKQAAMDSGMNGFIAKPIELEKMFKASREALQ